MSKNPTINLNVLCKLCAKIAPCSSEFVFTFLYAGRSIQNASEQFISHIHFSFLPHGSDVRSVLPDGQVISSRHAGWGSSRCIDLPCPLQSVCQRHALTLAPRPVSPIRGRHGHHSHVQEADAARQLPGVIPQQSSTVVE